MYRHGFAHANRRGGWAMLAALVVIVIIMLVLLNTWFKPSEESPAKPQVVVQIRRADHAAVLANLNSMNTTLQMMYLNDPGREFTMDELRAKLNPPASRSGGDYVIGTDHKVYFTGFDDTAPPTEMLSDPKVITLK